MSFFSKKEEKEEVLMFNWGHYYTFFLLFLVDIIIHKFICCFFFSVRILSGAGSYLTILRKQKKNDFNSWNCEWNVAKWFRVVFDWKESFRIGSVPFLMILIGGTASCSVFLAGDRIIMAWDVFLLQFWLKLVPGRELLSEIF